MKSAIPGLALLALVLTLAPTASIADDGDFARTVRFRASDTYDRELADAVSVVIDRNFLPQIVEAWKEGNADGAPSAPSPSAAGLEDMIRALRAAHDFMANNPRWRFHGVTGVAAKGIPAARYWEVVVLTAMEGRRSMPSPMTVWVTSDFAVMLMEPRLPGRR